jgi:hypothetical protein
MSHARLCRVGISALVSHARFDLWFLSWAVWDKEDEREELEDYDEEEGYDELEVYETEPYITKSKPDALR